MNGSNFGIIRLMQLLNYIENEWVCYVCFGERKSERTMWWVGVVIQSDIVCVCVVSTTQPPGA